MGFKRNSTSVRHFRVFSRFRSIDVWVVIRELGFRGDQWDMLEIVKVESGSRNSSSNFPGFRILMCR